MWPNYNVCNLEQIAKHEFLAVTYLPTKLLKPRVTNARTHPKHQIRQIADSIRCFGFVNPVILDKHDQIMAGHSRVAVALLLGMESVPMIWIEHLSPDQIRAYVLADNKLVENEGWNKEILAIEL